MTKTYAIIATLTVRDTGLFVEAGSATEALAYAQEDFGDPMDWDFHVADGTMSLEVKEI